jgi:hypothetical protein
MKASLSVEVLMSSCRTFYQPLANFPWKYHSTLCHPEEL